MSETGFELGTTMTNTTTTALQERSGKPLSETYQVALTSYSPEEQTEIIALSEQINVADTQKVMAYGAPPLLASFEQCGAILKEEEGSSADKRVIKEVVELSKQVNDNFEEFNLLIKEAGPLEKLFSGMFFKGKKEKTAAKLRESAASSYRLLMQLNESYKTWLEMLQNSMYQITSSYVSEKQNNDTLEKYIIAGYLANERVGQMLLEKKERFEQTGLSRDEESYNELMSGQDDFLRVILSLEKASIATRISMGRLKLIEKTNKNAQLAITEQQKTGMPAFAQNLRDALFDYKNREVMEGHQSIMKLTDELMKKVTSNAALSLEESKKIIEIGSYSLVALKESLTTLNAAFENDSKYRSDAIAKSKAELTEITKLLEQLEPHISKIKEKKNDEATMSSITTSTDSTTLRF